MIALEQIKVGVQVWHQYREFGTGMAAQRPVVVVKIGDKGNKRVKVRGTAGREFWVSEKNLHPTN